MKIFLVASVAALGFLLSSCSHEDEKTRREVEQIARAKEDEGREFLQKIAID